jgi:hypothetical protein
MQFATFYNEPDNQIYDDAKVQIIGGDVKLLAIVSGAEAELYAKLDDNQGLVAIDSSGNDNHGAFQGGYTENQWVPGKINSAIKGISSSNGFINFNQLINFERTDPFSLECWIKFTSLGFQSAISKQTDGGAFEGFGLGLNNGKVRFTIRDISLNICSVESSNSYNDGFWHHVVVTWDGNNVVGGMNIYVDNVNDTNDIVSGTLSATITNAADFQISGRDGNNDCIDITTTIDEVLVYSRELTTAEIAFRWNSGNGTQVIPGSTTSFSTDNPRVESKVAILMTQILDFNATETITGSDEVRRVIDVNGVDFYWSGIAWIESSGPSQTNTLAEIKANAPTLDLGAGEPVKFPYYLSSSDGTTTPTVSDQTVDFNSITAPVDEPSQCLVTGIFLDRSNNPISNGVIEIYPTCNIAIYNGSAEVCIEKQIINTEADGSWEAYVTETENMDILFYFKFICDSYTKIFKKGIPNKTTERFAELNSF